jgi:hypothetical protein
MIKNTNSIRNAAIGAIITVTTVSVLGYLVDPELVSYTPEDPAIFSKQKAFALLSAVFGMIVGAYYYKK